ncbi:MAG: (2Fe-2S)-binding protein [Gemmatimonadales bacterium]
MRIALAVNGSVHTLDVEPRASLLDALRDGVGLTGAKLGCERGECGTCTVLVRGRPIYSCLALACESQHVPIETIEGLANPPEQLHPIQRAFVAADALQCGFCTPGQILSATALLRDNPRPTDAEIKRAMAGNLCRCGTYPKIRKAIQAVTRASPRPSGRPAVRPSE